jgi:hypothetical protein
VVVAIARLKKRSARGGRHKKTAQPSFRPGGCRAFKRWELLVTPCGGDVAVLLLVSQRTCRRAGGRWGGWRRRQWQWQWQWQWRRWWWQWQWQWQWQWR